LLNIPIKILRIKGNSKMLVSKPMTSGSTQLAF
jgi:hypothetical protein